MLGRHVADGGEPEEVDQPLSRWLWMTSYGEYFASMNSTRLRRALEHLRKVARGEADPKPPDLSEEIAPPPRRFDFRAARSRVMALTLADFKPRSSIGKELDTYALLATHGREAAPKLLPSSALSSRASEALENRVIAAPADVKALRDALREPKSARSRLATSHGITPAAARALQAGRLEEFLLLRRRRLLEQERQWVEDELGLTYGQDA